MLPNFFFLITFLWFDVEFWIHLSTKIQYTIVCLDIYTFYDLYNEQHFCLDVYFMISEVAYNEQHFGKSTKLKKKTQANGVSYPILTCKTPDYCSVCLSHKSYLSSYIQHSVSVVPTVKISSWNVFAHQYFFGFQWWWLWENVRLRVFI